MYKIIITLAASLLLSGCFTVVSYPNQARLCTFNKEPWDKNQRITLPTDKGDDYISYNVYDVLDKQTRFNDGQNFWIEMSVDNTARKRISYESKKAFISTPGGIIKADPELYLGGEGLKKRFPGVTKISDLKNVPFGTTVFIRFPIRNPIPEDEWTISLGEYKFMDEAIKIPEYKLCRVPGDFSVRRYRGAF